MAKKELDSVYFLKLVLYVIIGSQWVWLVNDSGSHEIPLPLGLLIGVWFASRERFQIDRKIEYALILIAAFIGFWVKTGLYFSVLK